MRTFSLRPSPAMVVALLALFVALGGVAYAAVTIDGKDIKKGSEPGNRLQSNSVTGQQVNESTLGIVARARLAGIAMSGAKRFDVRIPLGNTAQPTPALTDDGFGLSFSCLRGDGGDNLDDAFLFGSSSPAGSAGVSYLLGTNGGNVTARTSNIDSVTTNTNLQTFIGLPFTGYGDADGQVIFYRRGATLTVSFHLLIDDRDPTQSKHYCRVVGTAARGA